MAVGADPQSRSVPVKKLQAGAPLVAKAEEMAPQRIRLKKPLGQSKESIKPAPHIGRAGQQIHLAPW